MYALLLAAALASCDCPNPLFRTDTGLLACGERDGESITELKVLDCASGRTLLSFSALHPMTLQRLRGGRLRIVEHSEWPFGRHWTQIYVPVAEYLITGHEAPRPRVLTPKPQATPKEIRAFIARYRELLSRRTRPVIDDTTVGKMYACVIAGSREARRLFDAMPRDAELDGAAAEAWDFAHRELLR